VDHFRLADKRSTCSQDTDDQNAYFFYLAGAHVNLTYFGASLTLVRHSTGGGEVERYIGRHGTRRVGRGRVVTEFVCEI
jgi:non-heme chloroperoxidase